MKVINQNPWQTQTPAGRWLGSQCKNKHAWIRVRRPLSNKACAKLCMRRQHTCWGFRSQGFILHVTDVKNKSHAKWNLQTQVFALLCTWKHSEKFVFSVWFGIDYPETPHTQHCRVMSRSTLHPLCPAYVGLCSALLARCNSTAPHNTSAISCGYPGTSTYDLLHKHYYI